LLEELTGIKSIQKMSFSCSGSGDLFDELKEKMIKQIIVCGIESHVCVQQTVLDLLANGFQVDVAADAVSSRKEIDYKTALNRMRSGGAEVTTTESILFELLNVCGTDEFKAVSKLVK
jgi:nicotinamidase-related amidase